MNDTINTDFFDKHFDDLERRQAARRSTALMLGTGAPDLAAEGVQLGAELNIPPQAVMGAPDIFRGQAETLRATTALRNAPNVADWLGDPINGALAKDDLDNLTWFERNFGAGGRALGRGTRRLTAIPDTMAANKYASLVADIGQSYEDFEAEMIEDAGVSPTSLAANSVRELARIRYRRIAGLGDDERTEYIRRGAESLASAQEISRIAQAIPMSETAARFRDGRLANSENTLMGTLSAFVDDPIGGAAFIAETAAETLPILAAATATTATTKSPSAGVAVMAGGSYFNESSNAALQFLQKRGVDMSTPEAAAVVLQDRELMEEARAMGVHRGLIIAAFDAASGGVAGKALLENPAGGMVVQGIAQAAFGAGGEATAQLATEGKLNWREIVIEGLAEFATAPIEVIGVGGRGMLDMMSRYARSGETAATVDEIDAVAAESQVRARSADKFLEALEASNMDDQALHVSAEAMQEYFQAKDVTLDDETLRAWGINPRDFSEKLTSGGDVTVPVANYAARISGTEDAAWFRENSALDPSEMSVSEAADFNERVSEILAEEFDRHDARMESERLSRASDVQIYDDVFSQLRAAGRSPDVAQQEATVWSSFWRAMGERYGEDSLDLARSMGVAIQGPQTPEVSRRRDQLDVMLNTLRSQGEKALAPRGSGILDFVRDLGGIRDRGGDLASLDVPSGVIAETAAEIRERESQPRLGGGVDFEGKGRGLDEIGRAMIEAGYFPEYMGGADTNPDGTRVDEEAIAFEAISEAVAGRDRFIEGEGPDQDMADLAAALSERGIDLSASNDEIVAALQGDNDGQQFDQSPPEGSDAFREWSGSDHVLDPDEVNYEDFTGAGPWVMRAYHGTTHEFTEFDASERGNKEGQFGAVNYFTTSEVDASGNYGADGADLTGRIERRAEILEQEIEDDPSAFGVDDDADFMEVARKKAAEELVGQSERVLEVFVRTEKPFVVGGDTSPFAEFTNFEDLESRAIDRVAEDEGVEVSEVEDRRDEFEDQIDEARWELEDETENPLFVAVQEVADRYEIDASALMSDLSEIAMEGSDHNAIEQVMRNSESIQDAENAEDGGLIGYHVLAEIIEALGFDSIILKNADQRFEGMDIDPDTAHIHVFDRHNANIKSATDNAGTFDRNNPNIYRQEKRGSIVLPRGGLTEGQTVINLFESADLSTFLHESGHFFLEAFTALATSDGAPQAMLDDLSVIHKFLEVEDGGSLTRDQHEKWARGFEAYLMEGKAPSLGLASAFARFKAWMTRIYRAVRNLDVKLTPEVREVMDRMLATDEEIAAMRDDLAMRPLFTDAAPAGMSDADFATYQRIAQRSADQAEASLMKRTMEKVRRETQAWFKEEKAAVRAEVEGNANRMPVYRLTEMLANQRWIGDEARDVPNIQMDRDALVDQFGDGVIAELSRSRLGGKRAVYTKGGERPELVAEMFGFTGVVEMVQALQNAGKRKDYINIETDRIMTSRHGDPLNDGSIEEAAALAVHSDQQAAMVTTEARAIAKKMGLPTRNIKAKEYRARAKAMLGNMSVREASRSASFLQAERRAAKTAEKAFAQVARGGTRSEASLAEAMQAKEQQMLNHFLYREARDFEARLQRAREKFRSFQKESVRKAIGLARMDEATGEMVPGHIDQIDALLDRYDFRSRSDKQVRNSESLMAYVQRMTDEGRADELAIDPAILRDAERRHYTRLSVDEFAGLVDTVANIEHMGRRRARLTDRKRKRDLNEVASRVSGLVRERFGSGKSDAQSGAVRNFFNLLLRMDTVAIDIDKSEMGDFYDAIKRPIDEGSAAEQKMNAESAAEIDNLFSVYTSKEKRDFNTARVIPGANGQPWSKQQILSVALNTGNKENLQRVLDRRVDRSVRLSQTQLDALLDTLDKRDWDFVQSIWDFVGRFQKDSFDVAERMTGVRPKAVEAAAVQTKFGTYRGGYYPIGYDPTKSKAAQLDAESALDQFLSAGRGNAAKVADGFTKGRAQSGGGRAVLYDFSVMMRHSVDAARLIALAEPVYNAQRILNHRAVADAFRDGGQANLLSQINLFLQDVASGPAYSSDPINSASRFMKNNFTLSRLAFNLKTVALQITGLGQSAAVIGKRNLMRGFNEYRKNPARVASEVLEKSAFMAERQTTFQKDVFDAHNEARVSSPIASRWRAGTELLSKAGFAPMVKTQFYVVDLPTWIGAFEAEIRRNGGDEEKAIHYADRMVDRSQGGGFMADRNALERGTLSRNVRQADFVRLWTTLGGYMVTKLNRGYVTAQQGARAIGQAQGPMAKVAKAANMATDLTLLFVFEAVVMGLAYSLLTDEEEDEDIGAFIAKETAAAALGGIPFVREAFGAFNGYGAGGVLSSALEIPADVWTQASQGENDKSFRRSVADAVGFATGLPTTQSIRIIEEIIAGDDGSVAEAAFGRNPLEK